MLFNSIEFIIFLPLVFSLYWIFFYKNIRASNVFLLICSYIFYGWWDWRFLSLIVISSFADYLIGIGLTKTSRNSQRKLLLTASIVVNLGFLGFFKYFNFFSESFSDAFTLLGSHIETHRLNIILPVGISFYTFQTLSYTIDVYRKKLEPTKDIIAFFTFVSFFPQLVAGPIERASNLLPQFAKRRVFSYAKAADGLRQILWGMFKKVVIADNCAEYANLVFNNSSEYSGSSLLLGAFFFAFQIYGDFSGYSDIAIGTARLFGINLRRNFNYPYFSRDIAEFWRRWHISLSTWFRDYLYIPLGGSRVNKWAAIRNTFIIFIVSGFWHGANWTFICWGALNALYFVPLMLFGLNRKNIDTVAKGKLLPGPSEIFKMGITFLMVILAWIFFRANDVGHAFSIFGEIFSSSIFSLPQEFPAKVTLAIAIFVLIEWLGREQEYAIEKVFINYPRFLRFGFYYTILLTIIIFGGSQQEFIYFEF